MLQVHTSMREREGLIELTRGQADGVKADGIESYGRWTLPPFLPLFLPLLCSVPPSNKDFRARPLHRLACFLSRFPIPYLLCVWWSVWLWGGGIALKHPL